MATADSPGAPLDIHDLENAINWWRRLAPSDDSLRASVPVRALALTYASMVWPPRDHLAWSEVEPRAREAFLIWHEHQPESPCIAICSTAQGDPHCKGCGRHLDEIQSWLRWHPLDKRRVWRRLDHEKEAWRYNRYAERALKPREPTAAEVLALIERVRQAG